MLADIEIAYLFFIFLSLKSSWSHTYLTRRVLQNARDHTFMVFFKSFSLGPLETDSLVGGKHVAFFI